jgi:hypothetical protein
MHPSYDDLSKLFAYEAPVYTFRVSELISSFGYLRVNDAVFRKCFTTAFSPLLCQLISCVHAVRYLGGLSNCARNIGSGISCPR